jgi:DNA-binding CsgD family transcriptional regulator
MSQQSKSLSQMARELRLSRNTVKNRIKDGWSYQRIKYFYKVNLRLRRRRTDIQALKDIETTSGQDFRDMVLKIMEHTNKKREIAQALGISLYRFNSIVGQKFTANEINKMR